jgi:hypothetical protein
MGVFILNPPLTILVFVINHTRLLRLRMCVPFSDRAAELPAVSDPESPHLEIQR